jgi:hypothetical protein
MALLPILCSSELWCSFHPIFWWSLEFIPFCVPVSCEILPTLCFIGLWSVPSLFQLICEALSILCCSALWWFFYPLFQWAVKFFLSCVLESCEVLILCPSELWSSFHAVFQWAVKPGFSCQDFNMHGKKQLVCLPACLCVMALIRCMHWLWRQEKPEWIVMNNVKFCPSMCLEQLRKYPVRWTVRYSVYEARVDDIHCVHYVCYQWMFPLGLTSCIFFLILQ